MREIVARAPARIDLGGGWTDVPPYCDREGGFVCNVAIARYATATLRELARGEPRTEDPLARAVLKRAGLESLSLTVHNDFPVGAGLGGSSAASAAMLASAAEWRGQRWDRVEIAESGRRIEVEDLGVAGGRQDHYAATHGGALALTFTTSVAVRRLALSDATRRALPDRSVLVYTGQSRISGATITAVLGAYQAGNARVVGALRRMREIAEQMAGSIEHGDLDALGSQLAEHWEHQRSLDPAIPTPLIDEIVRRARVAGAMGAKAMGASGGGCVLILTRAGQRERVRDAVSSCGSIVDFAVDDAGLTVMSAA